MVIAAALSVERGLLRREDEARIVALLEKLRLPVRITVDKDAVLDAMLKDKKRQGGSIKFVLTNGLGSATIQDVSLGEIEEIVRGLD